MKKAFLSAVGIMAAVCSYGQFNMVNDAIAYTSGTDVGYAMNTTSCDGNSHACAIWSTGTLNFYRSFDITFYANFDPTRGSGADGIVAVFGANIKTTSSVNVGGGYIGYYNLPGGAVNNDFNNSLGVEYDIYYNNVCTTFHDPNVGCGATGYFDHIMVAGNADITTALTTPAPIDLTTTSVKDGVFRRYRLKWNCDNNTLYVYSKDTLRTQYSFNPALQFGSIANAQNVKWGFTSGIADGCADDTIKNIKVTLGTFCPPPCFDPNCHPYPTGFPIQPCTWQFTANGLCFGPDVIPMLYNWDFGDGSGDLYFPTSTVTHVFPTTGTYPVKLKKVIVYNRITGQCCEMLVPIILWPFVDCGGGPTIGGKPGNDAGIKQAGDAIRIFPNPTNDVLNIQTEDLGLDAVSIYNIVGQKVLDKKCHGAAAEKIDVHMLVSGSYIAEITDITGKTHKVSFVIKQ